MEMLSVEQVADELGLHVRTVRGYVRDGRLKAVRIGKQYRIARADLEALTGVPAPRVRHTDVAATVRIEGIGRGDLDRLATALTAAAQSGADDPVPLRVQLSYDEERASLTVMLLGGLAATTELLGLVRVLTEAEEGR